MRVLPTRLHICILHFFCAPTLDYTHIENNVHNHNPLQKNCEFPNISIVRGIFYPCVPFLFAFPLELNEIFRTYTKKVFQLCTVFFVCVYNILVSVFCHALSVMFRLEWKWKQNKIYIDLCCCISPVSTMCVHIISHISGTTLLSHHRQQQE